MGMKYYRCIKTQYWFDTLWKPNGKHWRYEKSDAMPEPDPLYFEPMDEPTPDDPVIKAASEGMTSMREMALKSAKSRVAQLETPEKPRSKPRAKAKEEALAEEEPAIEPPGKED